MRKFSSGSIGITQGSRVLFSDFVNDGVMWTGSGDRESRHVVTFKEPYREPPVVHLSLTMWDTDNQANARVDLSAENITTEGFHLVFTTWSDTRIARVRADWLVIGAIKDDDNWDVD
ncbi:H-type lectin domain-containing protein [Pseudotabrizicola sp. L79]|uniref:H-type lectin domain-containing protein n=1 Tax=Pseudotabrizicola sp. L79 TaxID=3118402 RepID=UPI002F95A61C